MSYDRYERKHRWTRWDHPDNVLAHSRVNENVIALRHAMDFGNDERCDDSECVCHTMQPGDRIEGCTVMRAN